MELQRLGKYELLDRLGSGGMGEVWKARDTELQRFVAIKLLHADLQADPDFVAHFTREARLVASLHHPNIVQIYDFQLTSTEGSRVRAYMVMDYIEGGTLADYILNTSRRGLYPPAAEILYLFTSVGLALDYAHQKGMIHRDIKPANILLDKSARDTALGEPVLSDFGIARLQGASASTVTGALIGTPLYISPEQAENRSVDDRSDLYSLGVVLYEILTGRTPFRGDNALAIMMQQIYGQPAPPESLNPRISPALSSVVLRSIAKEPRERFPSASDLAVALAQALNEPVPASLVSTRSISERPDYNPLQPNRAASGTTSSTPTLTATPPFTTTPPLPLPQPAQPERRAPSRRRLLLAAAAAVVLLAVIGVSAFGVFPRLFAGQGAATPTPNSVGVVVGSITFISSQGAPRNTFDELQVDLTNIPPAPPNDTYYAWLGVTGSEVNLYPNWQLPISNGAVHTRLSSSQHKDLLANANWFLITEEHITNPPSPPTVPNPLMHIYYANISPTSASSPVFSVRTCPQGSAANAIVACR